MLKPIIAIFAGLFLLGSTVVGQPGQPGPMPQGAAPMMGPRPGEMPGCEMQAGMPCPHPGMQPMDFAPNGVCYLPKEQVFVLIDSIDCAVDILQRSGDTMSRIGRFVTDNIKKRHDLKNILRPRSVSVIDGKVVVLVSSQKDSSYLALLSLDEAMEPCCNDSLEPVACVTFSSNATAFNFDPMSGELIVVGKNAVGYDIHVLSCAQGLNGISEKGTFHYHVPKQAERIKESDKYGVGLTVVAIMVVFVALVSIFFIMSGYGSLIMKIQDRKRRKDAERNNQAMPAKTKEVAGEVYAAIAAAIYMYDQDMHDDEDTVITIQKVDRAWTPWNAKFYNMNKYFNNRR